jgi:site-specific recombinase
MRRRVIVVTAVAYGLAVGGNLLAAGRFWDDVRPLARLGLMALVVQALAFWAGLRERQHGATPSRTWARVRRIAVAVGLGLGVAALLA